MKMACGTLPVCSLKVRKKVQFANIAQKKDSPQPKPTTLQTKSKGISTHLHTKAKGIPTNAFNERSNTSKSNRGPRCNAKTPKGKRLASKPGHADYASLWLATFPEKRRVELQYILVVHPWEVQLMVSLSAACVLTGRGFAEPASRRLRDGC